MARKSKEPTWAEFLGAIVELVGVIVGLIGRGLFWGLGFWWAFYEFMK